MPVSSLLRILPHAFAMLQGVYIILNSLRIAAGSRQGEPIGRLLQILGDAAAVAVQLA